MYSAKGKIWYNPSSPNTNYSKWWAVVLVPKELVLYYRQLVFLETGIKLADSAWGPHITFIRGEKPRYEEFWKKYNSEIIEFHYSPPCIPGKTHWVIPASSQQLMNIRKELGLDPSPRVDFHITLGRIIS
jgi:hypothetical protein